jgi:hypothetical protein
MSMQIGSARMGGRSGNDNVGGALPVRPGAGDRMSATSSRGRHGTMAADWMLAGAAAFAADSREPWAAEVLL